MKKVFFLKKKKKKMEKKIFPKKKLGDLYLPDKFH